MTRVKLLRFKIRIGDNILPYRMPYNTETDMEWAKEHSVDGKVDIEEAVLPDLVSKPTQLDVIEAQVTYTAMMTDTLLEV